MWSLDVDGLELCVDAFGDAQDPAVLLIGGASSSMDAWHPDWCARLAASGRYVVRYDHRDTGRSSTCAPGDPDYTGRDLTDDVLRILDGLSLVRVHLVGVSMGAGIAQDVAARHPSRVETITLIATTAAGDLGASGADLPSPLPRIIETFEHPAPEPDWADRDAVIASLVDELRTYAGSLGLDEADARAYAAATFDRSIDVRAARNHGSIAGDESDAPPIVMADIAAPTLVVHGSDDPMFPLPHGEALAAAIPGARLLVVDGMGHEAPPRPTWDVVVPAILDHTGAARPRP
ncbi:MAG TPA: alpha/beta hydrolase [Acidimicrobiales bacterium]|nr:alpha/beta hydrolase [Acidimicrobiales bacterium]